MTTTPTIPLPPPTSPAVTSAAWADPAQTIIRAVIGGETLLVPDDQANLQRRAIDAAGVAIGAYLPPPPTLADFTAAITAHLDAVARARSYDGALSIASYVASAVPGWAAEAQVFVAWRDAVWSHALAEMAKVEAGQRAAPTVADFLAELPQIAWPD